MSTPTTAQTKSTEKEALIGPLEGKIALVTGASRGIGRGIALQLAKAGATVYLTGRPVKSAYTELGMPSLEQTVKDIVDAGGKAVAAYCDHSNPDDVKSLFERIERENDGNLDILVNNAYSGAPKILENEGKKFYECDPSTYWDDINEVGLRNVYICCCYAARLMTKRGGQLAQQPAAGGLIVNISSVGCLQYLVSVAYGVGKAAVDRMSADMAFELKDTGVSVVSLWPGMVQTELLGAGIRSGQASAGFHMPQEYLEETYKTAESPEFTGKAVVGLACDKNRMAKSGKILLTSDLALEYGFTDSGGRMPPNMRSVRLLLERSGWLRVARFIPEFVRLPKQFMHFGSYKF